MFNILKGHLTLNGVVNYTHIPLNATTSVHWMLAFTRQTDIPVELDRGHHWISDRLRPSQPSFFTLITKTILFYLQSATMNKAQWNKWGVAHFFVFWKFIFFKGNILISKVLSGIMLITVIILLC